MAIHTTGLGTTHLVQQRQLLPAQGREAAAVAAALVEVQPEARVAEALEGVGGLLRRVPCLRGFGGGLVFVCWFCSLRLCVLYTL